MPRKRTKPSEDTFFNGTEHFTEGGKKTAMTLRDFWGTTYSDLNQIAPHLAEYLVLRALNLKRGEMTGYWKAHKILYRNASILIRSTTYLDESPVNGEKSRNFRCIDIRNREVDLYVICECSSEVAKEMLNLDNWDFFVTPMWLIESECGKAKNIRMSRVRRTIKAVPYRCVKRTVNEQIDKLTEAKRRRESKC